MKPRPDDHSSPRPSRECVRIEPHPQGVVVLVHAQPGARSEGISGVHAEGLKICLRQVPEKGKANKVLTELLAQALGVARSEVELLSGAGSRRKRFLVQGVTSSEVHARLSALLDRLE